MVKIAEAQRKLFEGVFVCRRCKSKIRTQNTRIMDKSVKCRKCGSKDLRAKKMKK